ncbi:MAG TPA: hypothetical protein VGM20_14750 [Gemmatimonadales bacterium]|jgi:hypothetical protein
MRYFRACLIPAALVAIAPVTLPAQTAGAGVLKRMHDKYAGKWFTTLTFSQKTTRAGRNGGAPTVATWYEAMWFTTPSGAKLRIDTGEPSAGNGVLYTSDSSWSVRAGVAQPGNANGNAFIPLIENVYLQPVDETIKQLAEEHIDFSKVANVTWEGRPAWAVGASSPTDTTSPQFWIDKDRLVLVRMFVTFSPTAPPLDVHLDNIEPTGGGWLATKVTMLRNGSPVQTEEYSDWKTRMPLDPKLFDPSSWNTVTHWTKTP